MLAFAAGLMVVAGLVLAVLAIDVARRRGVASGLSLAVVLVAAAWWGLTYALELSSPDLGTREAWGDLKYLGPAVLAPAWLVFVLRYTGRGHLVTRRLLLALSVEPVLVMAALFMGSTHNYVKHYEPPQAGEEFPVAAVGPLFWVHFAYLMVLVVLATALFVVTMLRVSRLYWRLATVLLLAAVCPLVLNLLFNFGVGPFVHLDLTPFAFVVTGGVLVWGLFRERLVPLAPLGRDVALETMSDGVLVLDAFGRVVDANPAAAVVLGRRRTDLIGRPLADLLPCEVEADAAGQPAAQDAAAAELVLVVDGGARSFDVRRQPLSDRSGTVAGQLVVLRDVTERKATEVRLRELLAERTRVASALQSSLLPARLPEIPGLDLAAEYAPAGDGREIGGDFYDVFPIGHSAWGVVLGDVSGKGAEAAAVTAQIRYSLRTLATDGRAPSEVLGELNTLLLREQTLERFCTIAYGVVRPEGQGLRLTLSLGGHYPPLLYRDGVVVAVGEPGTALGLLTAPELHDSVVDLYPGDLLCLYTDGLVEARQGGELFGEHRAARVISGHAETGCVDVAHALGQAVREYRGGPLCDDLALLLLDVKPRSRPRPQPVSWRAASAD